jgi:hypothetical protein
MSRILAFFVTLLVATSACSADFRVPLPNRDDPILNVPDDWKPQVRSPRPDLPPTIAITSGKQGELMILVTPIWPANSGIPNPTQADVRKLVQGAADAARPKAVERDLALVNMETPEKIGYYFSATDREPEPGGYKYPLCRGRSGATNCGSRLPSS